MATFRPKQIISVLSLIATVLNEHTSPETSSHLGNLAHKLLNTESTLAVRAEANPKPPPVFALLVQPQPIYTNRSDVETAYIVTERCRLSAVRQTQRREM